ncbi:MAG TPA: hypothetical protein VGB35_11735 [Gammaproteobacteria bacterium]
MAVDNIIIDLEASGLYGASYPLSVAWGSRVDAIEYHLIRPEDVWLDEGDWDAGAEAIHGFTLEQLLDEGEPALQVAERLAQALAGRVVYSDAPAYDRNWLEVLHRTTGVASNYEVADFARLVPGVHHLNHLEYALLREQAFKQCGAIAHTADGDVKALLTLAQMRGR